MSHHRNRRKGRASQHPELVLKQEMKLNDSNANEDEVLEINNAHREFVKATRKYQLSEKLQDEYCNRLQRIIKWIFIFYRCHHVTIYVPIIEAQQNNHL